MCSKQRWSASKSSIEILARLSIYMLPECTPNFSSLLKSYLTPRIIPETLLIVLLDWAEPWHWVRQLRNWIRFLKSVMTTLDSDCKEAIEENMNEWQLRRRGGGSLYDPAASGAAREGNINIPLSQGEWDEPLGLPICVVCHGVGSISIPDLKQRLTNELQIDKIDTLEREQSWKEEEFDFVLQYLRTILLKRNPSLSLPS